MFEIKQPFQPSVEVAQLSFGVLANNLVPTLFWPTYIAECLEGGIGVIIISGLKLSRLASYHGRSHSSFKGQTTSQFIPPEFWITFGLFGFVEVGFGIIIWRLGIFGGIIFVGSSREAQLI